MAALDTITIETAVAAVHEYNNGTYPGITFTALDCRAREQFAEGLGTTEKAVEVQVRFIGKDYIGAAMFNRFGRKGQVQ